MNELEVAYPEWAWHPQEGATVAPSTRYEDYKDNHKLLTVIFWDGAFRDDWYLRYALDCYQKQSMDLDKVDFMWIEWTNKPNPIVLEYDFLDVYCMNLKKDLSKYPAYDTGIQWNLGLYLSRTEWVQYQHCDIVARDNLVKTCNLIKEKGNNPYIFFEGWAINRQGKRKSAHVEEVKSLFEQYGQNFDMLPYMYNGPFKTPYGQGGNHIGDMQTVNKNKLIELTDGFYWNTHENNRAENWTMMGRPGMQNINSKLRQWLKERNLYSHEKDLAFFTIPHDRELWRFSGTTDLSQAKPNTEEYKKWKEKHNIWAANIPPTEQKYYSDLVNDWLPQHNITHYNRRDKTWEPA
jgi:hypothetical protein